MLARFNDAALLADPPAAEVVADADEDAAAELEEAALLEEADDDAIEAADEEEIETEADDDDAATLELALAALLVEEAMLDAALPVLASVEEADAEPEADAVKQDEDPELTVKAAEFATAPVLSRRVRPREVPAAMLVDQVYEVPVCVPRLSMAAALGWLPGWMLKK